MYATQHGPDILITGLRYRSEVLALHCVPVTSSSVPIPLPTFYHIERPLRGDWLGQVGDQSTYLRTEVPIYSVDNYFSN